MLNKVACILFLVACAGSDERDTITTEAPVVAAPKAVVTASPSPAPSTPPPVAPARAGSWRDRVSADIASLKASSPQLFAELTQLAPSKTRAGFVRFTSDTLHDPRAASVFIDRLVRGGDAEDVRAALVEALPRTGGAYADAAVELFATERSASVRTAYVFAARRAPSVDAIALMTKGLSDGDVQVQAEAARSAAAHVDGGKLAVPLRTALASSDPTVRAASARSLGILKIAGARDLLAARISDDNADVRLEALRAVDRIDPAFARTLPLARLANDSDPRIVGLVTRLTGAPSVKAP